ncbi:DUF305 domain-containing protein [Georgenia sp. TF02-10]|uniref:DUF305 domain-containing protein n=1 Tax=Georgenia sp. TF02-10 TaxID=2917725 RepID=UPI001FA7DD1E|nr:DUF305 domain-containing protein [Georgenia sp. TF02-10]UNX55695.1 DUF305 domain-containing protein [Georgenia sp. TF02-10]
MKIAARLTALAGAGLLVITLAACGSGSDETTPEPETTTTAETATPTPGSSAAEVDEAHNDDDTMFAQMMIVHHQGAIEMADLAVERATAEEVRTLASDISAAQGPEIEEMTSWLEVWGEDTSADPTGHMDHGGMDMDGMSQAEAMEELESLSGTDFDRRFLELMTAHHEGAVSMAETELDQGENPQALELAQQIIDDQTAEIAEMEEIRQGL